MDRRQKKTREAIFKAFGKLLEEKHFNHITVQQIIEEADVGRSTFYAHFETKDELLKAMCTDIFSHVFSHELTTEKSHDFSDSEYSFQEKLTHILYHIQDSKREISGILSCESGELFLRYFKEYLVEVFKEYLEQIKVKAPKEYMLNHLVCSFAETVLWWIRERMKQTPEEMAEYYMEMMPHGRSC